MKIKLILKMTGSLTTMTVEGTATDLPENHPAFQTDVDKNLKR